MEGAPSEGDVPTRSSERSGEPMLPNGDGGDPATLGEDSPRSAVVHLGRKRTRAQAFNPRVGPSRMLRTGPMGELATKSKVSWPRNFPFLQSDGRPYPGPLDGFKRFAMLFDGRYLRYMALGPDGMTPEDRANLRELYIFYHNTADRLLMGTPYRELYWEILRELLPYLRVDRIRQSREPARSLLRVIETTHIYKQRAMWVQAALGSVRVQASLGSLDDVHRRITGLTREYRPSMRVEEAVEKLNEIGHRMHREAQTRCQIDQAITTILTGMCSISQTYKLTRRQRIRDSIPGWSQLQRMAQHPELFVDDLADALGLRVGEPFRTPVSELPSLPEGMRILRIRPDGMEGLFYVEYVLGDPRTGVVLDFDLRSYADEEEDDEEEDEDPDICSAICGIISEGMLLASQLADIIRAWEAQDAERQTPVEAEAPGSPALPPVADSEPLPSRFPSATTPMVAGHGQMGSPWLSPIPEEEEEEDDGLPRDGAGE